MNSPHEAQGGPPLFFTSYARTPVFDPYSDNSPDYWVRRFYRDLTEEVGNLLPAVPAAGAGFMDLDMNVGENWPDRISAALATCRIFVALSSPRYFLSESCGREWAAVEDRIAASHVAGRPPSVQILPVIWAPLDIRKLPRAARSIRQFTLPDSPAYQDFGVSGLIRLRQWRDDYSRLLFLLAQQIASAAADPAPVDDAPVRDYSRLRNAFEDGASASPMPQLTITVLALDSDSLPKGRTSKYYGRAARDWRPFAPEVPRTLADASVDLATSLNFRPVVEDWRTSGLGDPPTRLEASPGLLLVDPWAVRSDGEAREWLKLFDAAGHESTAIVIANNPQDRQSAEAAGELTETLGRTLPARLAAGGLRERSVAQVNSLEQLGRAVPTVTSAAARQFLRLAKAYPPKGDPVAKPRLRGPATSPADGGPQPEGSAQ